MERQLAGIERHDSHDAIVFQNKLLTPEGKFNFYF